MAALEAYDSRQEVGVSQECIEIEGRVGRLVLGGGFPPPLVAVAHRPTDVPDAEVPAADLRRGKLGDFLDPPVFRSVRYRGFGFYLGLAPPHLEHAEARRGRAPRRGGGRRGLDRTGLEVGDQDPPALRLGLQAQVV